ncbi:MAG: CPBP family intramembrane glutamic endopeptidase [Candidatus Competibacteraceae bacterium]
MPAFATLPDKVRKLHPRRFFQIWQTLDREAAAERTHPAQSNYRAAVALITAAFCLLLIHYLKFATTFQAVLEWLSWAGGQEAGYWQQRLTGSGFFSLLAYAWWWFWHLVGYVLLPVLIIKIVLRDRVSAYGVRLGSLARHFQWYILLAAPIICFAFFASFREDFVAVYPFYRQAHRSGFDLLIWECLYLSQFACLEFFFRGFLLHACKPAFGANAILVMCLPYLMIHFPKPWLEATGAIFFGLFLGILALRTRSIWGGVLVHISIALSMDLLALWQTHGLPVRWWP